MATQKPTEANALITLTDIENKSLNSNAGITFSSVYLFNCDNSTAHLVGRNAGWYQKARDIHHLSSFQCSEFYTCFHCHWFVRI